MRRLFLALSAAAVLSLVTTGAADQVPASRYATIEVAITDKGQPVIGLTKADFQLFLDGKQQQLVSFRTVEEPTERVADPGAALRLGKTVMILFDVHAMTSAQAPIAQTAAVKYVENHMRRQDLFAVAVYGRNLQIVQPFTTDVEKVIGAIRRPLAAFGTAQLERGFAGDEGLQLGKNALLSLRSLCEDLAQVRGPKSVLVFSQDFFAPGGEQYSQVVEAARRAKVSFYTLITTQASAQARPPKSGSQPDGRSGRAAGLSGLAFSSFAPQQRGGPPASTPTGPTGTGIADPSVRDSATRADQAGINWDILQALAKETNGDLVRESNNLTMALQGFDPVLSNYYILGFLPSSGAERWKVEVKTSRKGARLSYPKILYAPGSGASIDGTAARRLWTALESGSGATGSASQLKSIVLKREAEIGDVVCYTSGTAQSETIAVAALASREDGTPAAYSQATAKEGQPSVGPVTLTLPAGTYRVRMATANRTGEVSVTEQKVTVPRFADDQMVAGDLMVSAQVSPLPDLIRAVPPWLIEGHPLVFKGYEITPSITNRSSRTRPLPLFFLLSNAGPVPSELVSDPRLTDEKGQTTLLPAVRHLKTADPRLDGSVALGFSLAVGDLRPGKYHLTVYTRGAVGKEPASCETDVWLE